MSGHQRGHASAFPVALIPAPPSPTTTSARSRSRTNHTRAVVNATNRAIRALNWLHSPSKWRPVRNIYNPLHPVRSLYTIDPIPLASHRADDSALSECQRRVRRQVRAACHRWLMVSRHLDDSQGPCDNHTHTDPSTYTEAIASDMNQDQDTSDILAALQANSGIDLSYAIKSAAQPIIADQVSLPSSLHVQPLTQLLPPDMAATYGEASPALLVTDEQHAQRLAEWGRQHRRRLEPRPQASNDEYAKLIRRMEAVGMIAWTTAPQCVNGLFAVPKPDGSQRVIIDARPANMRFTQPPRVRLPTPTHLAQMQTTPDGILHVAKMDLSNFYHHLGLPAWMQPYFALPFVERAAPGEPQWYPMCTTLPMGFSHAVLLAQQVHEHTLYSRGALQSCDNILEQRQPTIHRPIHELYIDDNCLIGTDQAELQQQYSRCMAAYADAGLLAKPEKCTPPTSQPTEVLGVMVGGKDHHIRLSPTKMKKLIGQTIYLLHKQQCSGTELARLLGHWTWAIMLRRPALAVLQNAYIYVNRYKGRQHTLWPCVRHELDALIGLAPLLYANLAAPRLPLLPATDASMTGSGVVLSALPPALADDLWYLATYRPADHVTVDNANGLLSPSPTQLDSLRQLQWSTVTAYTWSYGTDDTNHINELELQAVYTMVRHMLSRPQTVDSRLLHMVDNTVSISCLRKGRSSSIKLTMVLRKIHSHLLAASLALLPLYIRSEDNPADSPSRQWST